MYREKNGDLICPLGLEKRGQKTKTKKRKKTKFGLINNKMEVVSRRPTRDPNYSHIYSHTGRRRVSLNPNCGFLVNFLIHWNVSKRPALIRDQLAFWLSWCSEWFSHYFSNDEWKRELGNVEPIVVQVGAFWEWDSKWKLQKGSIFSSKFHFLST